MDKWRLQHYIISGLLTLSFVFVLMGLFGCAAESGKVTDKKYYMSWTEMRSTCMTYSKEGYCTYSVKTPIHHPERFCFKLDDGFWERCVPREMWNKYKIGDHFPGVGNG